MSISVVLIACNEEANLPRTLRSVAALVEGGAGEIVVVDSGSTDHTREVAESFGARVVVEPWRGFTPQKNFAFGLAQCDWILNLDADEELTPEAQKSIKELVAQGEKDPKIKGYEIARRNCFLGRWIKHGGAYPDYKLRLWWRGAALFEERAVHEVAKMLSQDAPVAKLKGDMYHYAYPNMTLYIEHMNRYSSLGAQIAVQKGQISRSLPAFFFNVLMRPWGTFVYNYFFRLGFLDGREGMLHHMYHGVYGSWKYAKAWETGRKQRG